MQDLGADKVHYGKRGSGTFEPTLLGVVESVCIELIYGLSQG